MPEIKLHITPSDLDRLNQKLLPLVPPALR
jgi:hypothetical protein